jgi:hypothetical protein
MAINPTAHAWYLLLIAALISGVGFYLLAWSDELESAFGCANMPVRESSA